MNDTSPSFSCSYQLTLDEAKDGFGLATFGKKRISRYLTPLMSVGIIIWGISLGMTGVGQFYVILGVVFLALQMLLRLVFLPKMFERQYKQSRMDEMQQCINLYQDSAVLAAGGQEKPFKYEEVQNFMVGQSSYMIELRDKMVIIVSKSAVAQTGQADFFESVFTKR